MPQDTLLLNNLSMADMLQYKVLRHIAPREKAGVASAYDGKSKIHVLLGDKIMNMLKHTGTVIDFGCGEGADSVELAKYGCTVVGVDIRESVLRIGREKAMSAGVSEHCTFTSTPTSTLIPTLADAIISIDAFEHFADPAAVLCTMHSLLSPGGHVYISFGWPWYHPMGGHLFSVFPWAHLLFSERALCAWRSHLRSDGAARFSEVDGGLNQMTIKRFEQLVHKSPLEMKELECVPIRKLRLLHTGFTREWSSAIVRAVLVRPILDR